MYGARLVGYYTIEAYLNYSKISKEELKENIKDDNLAELMSIFEAEPLKELEEKMILL